jgi:ubiquinone/menaquinone biosynthesis C-methylase UbiE
MPTSETNSPAFGIKFINPEEVIAQMGIQPTDAVADFGCGTGYFSFPIAKKVAGEGKVYALDILPQKLETIESQAKILGLTNVVTQRVNLEKIGGSKLESESVDWVLLVDILFQNNNKDDIFSEAKRVLKNGGKILVVEWNHSDSSMGPEQSLRIPKKNMSEIIQNNSLTVIKEIQAGDFHYGLILAK